MENLNLGCHRVIIKHQINDRDLLYPIPSGELLLEEGTFKLLKGYHPDDFIEIPMTIDEWVEYLKSGYSQVLIKYAGLKEIAFQLGMDMSKFPQESIVEEVANKIAIYFKSLMTEEEIQELEKNKGKERADSFRDDKRHAIVKVVGALWNAQYILRNYETGMIINGQLNENNHIKLR